MRSRTLLVLLGINTFAVLAGNAHAATYIQKHFVINGAQEVPPNGSAGSGNGIITVNTTTNVLHYDLRYTGLGSAENAAHIHGPAARGVIGGVLVALPAGSPKVGDWNYPEAQEANILGGLTYINVHTANFGGGEIRGQIEVVDAPATSRSLTGTYTGTINGAPIAGTSSGGIDVSGLGDNDMIIDFTAMPAGYHPFAIPCRKIMNMGGQAAKDSLGAQNLWELAGGNYTANTTYTWPSLPGDTIRATVQVTTTGMNQHYDMVLNGSYHGFTDLSGVGTYQLLMAPSAGSLGVLTETASPAIRRVGGATFDVDVRTVYSGVQNPLPVPSQVFRYKINTYTFSGSQYHLNWNATVFPATALPASPRWALVLLAALTVLLGSGVLLKLGRRSSGNA